MKKLRNLLLAGFLLAVAWSCGKNNPEPSPVDDPPKDITLETTSFMAAQGGETLSLTVTAPERPKVGGAPSWITVGDGTYSKYKITFTLKVAANTTFEERSAVLTVTSGSLSKTVSLTQPGAQKPDVPEPEPGSEIDRNLTNPHASAAAKRVYDFLRENAGKKVLSGIQSGGTANNNETADAVFKMTGKHPALAGYDYIFLPYSPTPANWDWKVDYGDISAAREQWENNGLVSFMWHWNVPTSKEAWDNGLKGNFDGYNFYCDKTGFDIRRALVAGNWENDFILKDIEKVAGYLKLLQAEGIPVLWRPLHEAAGNYNIYGSNGAWFWWGRGGADACKQLWKLLRDKLEGEYGLDNLIWVWTLDATVGAENDYALWYPGNDLVDIVGCDIYEENTSVKSRQYKAAVQLTGGRKLVTVSECGNIPDPEQCLSENQSWSWFLAWNLEDFKLNTTDYWKKLMGSARVFTRESMPSLK
ncbi:MAG: hypothetical protein IJ651_00685 [Bacteroidales bacterium]|nr:hypothetical protein [Bacteroidales bacterium]